MKNRHFFCFVAAAAILTGCEDLATRVRNDVLPGEPAPQVRTFPADPRATFAAARAAVDQMGYRFTRGGPAQGHLEAISRISPGDTPGSAHQFSIKADFRPTLDGTGTEVSVRMSEIIEADSERHQGQGTEVPLRDTALCEVFLRNIQQAVAAPPK